MARAFPASRFIGYDFSEEGVAAGREEAHALGPDECALRGARRDRRWARGAFDLITAFDAIHDQAQPARVLAGIAGALRPDGVFLMVDIRASSHLQDNLELPWAPFLYAMSSCTA